MCVCLKNNDIKINKIYDKKCSFVLLHLNRESRVENQKPGIE